MGRNFPSSLGSASPGSRSSAGGSCDGEGGGGGLLGEGAREGVSRGGGGASRVCGWGWVWQGLGMVGSGYCKDWLSLQLGLGMIGI